MTQFFRQLVEQIKALWNRLALLQRVILIAIPSVAMVGLIVLMVWLARPAYNVLYSNLTPQDAGAIVNKLKEMKIPHELAQQGSSILVPASYVYDTRLQLAGQGLPQGGGVGFEIFDKTSLGTSDFVQKLNYGRGLQGELARTIMGLEVISKARVHLVIPQSELYTEKEKDCLLYTSPSPRD